MIRGAILHLDVAQITLYAFWIFFAGLIWYLRQEDRREGYPLESEVDGLPTKQPWLFIPAPKTFTLGDGTKVFAPRQEAPRTINSVKTEPWPGAPYTPVGDPLLAGVGPGAYAIRPERPNKTAEGEDLLAPMRVATNFAVAAEGVNPLGFSVIGADRRIAGVVKDLWIDRSESNVRYYEVALSDGRTILAPIYFVDVNFRARTATVKALTASQLGSVPALNNPDSVTMQEEDKISAFFGGGTIYSTPHRTESLL